MISKEQLLEGMRRGDSYATVLARHGAPKGKFISWMQTDKKFHAAVKEITSDRNARRRARRQRRSQAMGERNNGHTPNVEHRQFNRKVFTKVIEKLEAIGVEV